MITTRTSIILILEPVQKILFEIIHSQFPSLSFRMLYLALDRQPPLGETSTTTSRSLVGEESIECLKITLTFLRLFCPRLISFSKNEAIDKFQLLFWYSFFSLWKTTINCKNDLLKL